jgi:hypothetical protein
MGTSAFDILFVPICWTTFGSWLAGAAILSLIRAIGALVCHMRRVARSVKAAPTTGRDRPVRVLRRIARGVGSLS